MLANEQGRAEQGRGFFLLKEPTNRDIEQLGRGLPGPQRVKVQKTHHGWILWISWDRT